MGLSPFKFFGGFRKTTFFRKSTLAVQGHPRSLIFVRIESVSATSY